MKIDLYVRMMHSASETIMSILDQNLIEYNVTYIDDMNPSDIQHLILDNNLKNKTLPIIMIENRERTIDELREIIASKVSAEQKLG